jgi:superfamily II DNA/RNA helicase
MSSHKSHAGVQVLLSRRHPSVSSTHVTPKKRPRPTGSGNDTSSEQFSKQKQIPGRKHKAEQQQEEEQQIAKEDERDSATNSTGGFSLSAIAASVSHAQNANLAAAKVDHQREEQVKKKQKQKVAEQLEHEQEEQEELEQHETRKKKVVSVPLADTPAAAPASAIPSAPAATAGTSAFVSLSPPLDTDLLHVLSSHFGFSRMTPVQAQTIPVFLRKDVSVQSYTGSGKTVAFVLPMLQILITKFTLPSATNREITIDPHCVAAIILSPTRELATQICDVIKPFVRGGKYASERLAQFRLMSFIGGSSLAQMEAEFAREGCNILVATPGRLNSTLGKLAGFSVSELRVLVLDEADRLLDEGFSADLTDILRKLPKQRRTGLFSATQTTEVNELRRAGLQEKFATIQVMLQYKRKTEHGMKADPNDATRTQLTPTGLQNFFSVVPWEHKLSFLIDFLSAHSGEKLIVFFLTGDQVEYYARLLPRIQILQSKGLAKNIFALRGGKHGMDQRKRDAQFDAFRSSSSGSVLLATDVAARGIDVPDVDFIVQFDPPKDPSSFVHRIGRTARAGRKGSALVFLAPEERAYISLIENLNVPLSEQKLSVDRFEPNHTWESDAETAKYFSKLLEEGKNIDARARLNKQKKKEKEAGAAAAAAAAIGSLPSAVDSKDPRRIKSVIQEVRYLNLEDRLLFEKSQAAFTSFIDGYKQHLLTAVLNYSRLPFADVAKGMGLLYLPKMPDMKHLMQNVQFDRAPIPARLIRFKEAKLRKSKRASRHSGRRTTDSSLNLCSLLSALFLVNFPSAESEHEKKEKLNHEKNQSEQESVEIRLEHL